MVWLDRRNRVPLTAVLLLLLVSGCSEPFGFGSSVFNQLALIGPDGKMKLEASYYPTPKDVPGCSGVICHTNGKNVYSSLWLSFYFYDTTPQGGELNLERINFGASLSSNSYDYTYTFTGKMILSEKTADHVIIYMDNVHFKIAHGEYTLNGNLIAKKK